MMELTQSNVSGDKIIRTGLLLIILSFVIFLLPEIAPAALNRDSYFGLFFFNYLLTGTFFLVLLVKFKWSVIRAGIDYTILLLILSLISAFSLNREMEVFEQSAGWLSIYLIIQCITAVLLIFRMHFPPFIRYILCFFLGTGIVIYIYFAVYLVPLYLLGFVGAIFFGISLHVFTPLLFAIFTFLLFIRVLKENKRYLYPFLTGIAVPVFVFIFFLVQWQQVSKKVNYILNEGVLSGTTLPYWVKLSQQMPKNIFTEKMLKADLVYTTPDKDSFWFWRMPQRSFDEVRKHDPLVWTASLFLGKPDLGEQEKIKILESMYDSRHQAQERLWAGDELETINVVSNIKVFPEYRIAYTEKVLSIRNNAEANRWRNEQEAIYTFHLPEGGVVTSLSLWINGKEEKSILTTKAKADSAYKTIVGVEARDPSVIHWQEGNTVSVRVFPCTPSENRKFKIGVTAPLRKEGKHLVYENIYFDGPSGKNATESVQIQFTQQPAGIDLPFAFDHVNNTYRSDNRYKPYWEVKFDAPALSGESFSFDGHQYTIGEYTKSYESFKPKVFYLDINNSWSEEELHKLWERIKDKEIYVYRDEWIKVDTGNKATLFEELRQLNFSLFPFGNIPDPETALVISKSNTVSPNLRDLENSGFSETLTASLQKHKKIRLFHIGHQLSPYLKTLKELRTFTYSHGSIADLLALLEQEKFVQGQENDAAVVIDNAQVIIRENRSETKGKGPDHLLRLFAYNHIMQKVSDNYFTDFISNEVIEEAQKAYVVSPVSSLIVLETQADYDRFGIEESKNSLQNASVKSSGAVPEPHEWLLILLTSAVVIYLFFKPWFGRKLFIRW